MTAPCRVVLDTNVVLSALVFAQGRLARLRHAWRQERCRPLASAATIGELMRALAYPKFALSMDEQRELLGDYLPYCVTVTIPVRRPRVPACRDPFDVPFLELAVIGKAHYLVSGDRDLLALRGRFACNVLTPEQFLGTLSEP